MTTSGESARNCIRLWLALLSASREIEAFLRARLRETHGQTLPRFDVMAMLYRNDGPMRMSDLSAGLRVTNGNVTGIVDRLVEDGMVDKQPCRSDGRAVRIQLTASGRDLFAAMAEDHARWVCDAFADIPDAEIDGLVARLKTIRQSLSS